MSEPTAKRNVKQAARFLMTGLLVVAGIWLILDPRIGHTPWLGAFGGILILAIAVTPKMRRSGWCVAFVLMAASMLTGFAAAMVESHGAAARRVDALRWLEQGLLILALVSMIPAFLASLKTTPDAEP
jgi:hypothetical protein